MFSTTVPFSEWIREVCERQPEAARLLAEPEQEQHRRGYYHTLREILQQPASWVRTADQVSSLGSELRPGITGIRNLFLTGSGSSEYAGHCVRLALQNHLKVNTLAVGGGVLLTNGGQVLPPDRPALLVSLARSGDSPESAGAIALLLEAEPELRHLVITCNSTGKLATNYRNHARVRVIALEDGTNDRSLVMTSSFTNLVVAAQFLGYLDDVDSYKARCGKSSKIVGELLASSFEKLAQVSSCEFNRAVYLGSGAQFGAARESALKMLEMTAGRVSVLPETYLGLRHGPMSYVDAETLVVCFLSSDLTVRAYEYDLIRELRQKNLGKMKIIVGENIPAELVCDQDLALECPGLADIGDDAAPLVDVVVAQMLAFFRCLREGLRPDSPSESGIINRVVQSFTLHFPAHKKERPQ
jgi:tagatose-6-phosphate ketose/aldose isomerase